MRRFSALNTLRQSKAYRIALALSAAVLSGTSWADSPPTEDWTQWRGPTRDSRITGANPWPKDLSRLSTRWRVALGPSYSGPIIVGHRVFVTETENETDEIVRALDRATGRELWRTSWSGAIDVPFFAKKNGDWIRATPACDGESLFVAGMRDLLVCLDVETGSERWRVDFPSQLATPTPAFGFVSSPLIVGDHVYVQAGAGFVKLNKRSGELVWRTFIDGGGMNSAFSSPVATTIRNVPQLIVQSRQTLAGVAPDDGALLWSTVVPSFRGMNILTPTVFDEGVLTSSYKNKTFFYRVVGAETDAVDQVWTAKAQGYMSSPVIIGEHAYLHLGNRRFCCINLKNGDETWRSEPFGEYWSMVANRDRILALDQRGELMLIAADPSEFRLLDREEVTDAEAWAHLAVVSNEVFVRDLNGITVYHWE